MYSFDEPQSPSELGKYIFRLLHAARGVGVSIHESEIKLTVDAIHRQVLMFSSHRRSHQTTPNTRMHVEETDNRHNQSSPALAPTTT